MRTARFGPDDTADVVIVGAGIAGLTAAIALDRIGINVVIVERAAALTQAGTALSIWPNAMAALDHIGLGEAVATIGSEEPGGVVRRPSGELLVRLDQSRLHGQHGTPTLVVHRGDLQQALLAAAAHLPIRMGTPVSRISTGDGTGVVELAPEEFVKAPIVLACDGVWSMAREVVGNRSPTFRGRSSWRCVLNGMDSPVAETCLTVGEGKQFIISPMRGGATYWAADISLREGANEQLPDRKTFLLEAFAGWHDPITELIERATEDQLVIADIYDSIPTRLVSGRIALLGDAAHPMTPDLGQGACQGIEDAVVMAECLRQLHNPEDALARYEAVRLRRVRSIVRESRSIGNLATSESRPVSLVRDAGIRRMPPWINRRLVARYASQRSFLRRLP